MFFDANGLYSGVMQYMRLPVDSFQTITGEISLEDILSTPSDAEFGFMLEVDINCPENLHDILDFPLCPTKEVVKQEWLSPVQRTVLNKHGMQPSRVKKLLQTYFTKKNYVLHYVNLKLYCELGMVVTNVHSVLKFRQEKIFSEFVEKNNNLRREAQSKSQEMVYKLASNAVFGKCLGKLGSFSINSLTNLRLSPLY